MYFVVPVFALIALFAVANASPAFPKKIQNEEKRIFIEVDVPQSQFHQRSRMFQDLQKSARVAGGTGAVKNQYPYQASVQYTGTGGNYEHLCGGAIIHRQWVATAAECIYSGYYRVQAGFLTINNTGPEMQSLIVSSVRINPNYKGGVGPNNIALLYLSEKLTNTRAVKPIGLPKKFTYPLGNSVFTGWGYKNSSLAQITDRLQQVTLPILSLASCKKIFDDAGDDGELIAESMICTGPLDGSASPCGLDTGGPLAQENVLIGLSNWIFDKCGGKNGNLPSVFTNVAHHIDFIKQHTR